MLCHSDSCSKETLCLNRSSRSAVFSCHPLSIKLPSRSLALHLFLPPLPPPVCPVVHKDGKNSRPYVFTIHSQHLSSHPVQTLDVAADSLEDLTCWVSKIREATQNADARVSTTKSSGVVFLM